MSHDKKEALGRLVLALKHMALADLLLPTEGVVFAYSAIDNALAALILIAGEHPPKNHGIKIGRFRSLYPKAEETVPRARHLNRYLDRWNAARYEGAECSVGEFAEVANAAGDMFRFTIEEMARATGDTADSILDSVRARAAQERVETYREEIGKLEEFRFQVMQMEVEGRAGFAAAATDLSNFISLHIDTDTSAVRQLLREHEAVTKAAVDLYEKFKALVEAVRMWNAGRMMDEHEGPSASQESDSESMPEYVVKAMAAGADFRLVALLSYRGRDLIEHMKQVWASLREAREKRFSEERGEKE